jgi:tripartite-type tricarboxylate transporter receptor subunit TctC
LALAFLVITSPGAFAQAYPSKPIKIITPTTAGSPVDVMARLLAPTLGAKLGQSVVIENRPGAGGTLGMRAVALAEPDGHTLLLHSVSYATAAAAYSDPGYDPTKSFVAVSSLGEGAWALVVPSSIPVNSVKEFIAYSKGNSGTLNFGFGTGTAPHIVGEAFRAATGADFASVPYKGGADAVKDMLGGRIHLNIGTLATLLPLIQDRKIKALAVTSRNRIPELPDVPTMAESGLPELTATFWVGVFAPARVPGEIVDKIHHAINDGLTSSDMQTAMTRVGFSPMPTSQKAFSQFVTDELARWAKWTQIAGVKFQ